MTTPTDSDRPATSPARISELTAADPFTQQQLATYDVLGFSPNRGLFALPLLEPDAAILDIHP